MKQKSLDVLKKPDPRSERTRLALTAGFLQLLSHRRYDRIRITDIVRKARVGRATFYAHFDSKEQLLRFEARRVAYRLITERADAPGSIDCMALFSHVQQLPQVWRSLTAGLAFLATRRIFQEVLEARIAVRTQCPLTSERASTTTPASAFASRFMATMLLELVEWSLQQQPMPAPSELQGHLNALTGPLISGRALCIPGA